MNTFFGYVRVSTARQGEQGVSLQQQREAIARHAQRSGLEVAEWFEEQETAAKRGRPVFGRMLTELRKGRARGVIIHKIDRSARNLKDWADLGELIDQGIEVHFANQSLDLNSRGGRLSADIQAVVAADFIRNLREETKKGFYGRLKQGLLPMPAPLGYRNIGSGKPKEPDPQTAPLVRQVFEIYSTARFSCPQLLVEIERLGLRGRSGQPITKNGLSTLLNNPFYMGLIHIGRTGESFAGVHEPLISKALFDRVQDILHGRINTRTQRHDFLFRRRLVCKACRYTLIGETHKSFVYYRCQVRECATTAIREEAVEQALLNRLLMLRLVPDERRYCLEELARLRGDANKRQEEIVSGFQLQLGQIEDRLTRLTDAYIDQLIDKDTFEQRKTTLLMERRQLEDSLAQWQGGKRSEADELQKILERGDSAYSAYNSGNLPEKRELVDTITSNRLLDGKSLEVALNDPFDVIASRCKTSDGSPRRDAPRTFTRLLPLLLNLVQRKQQSQEKVAA
jgi:DNA invertase Pin-like site-specific DNA recombinase